MTSRVTPLPGGDGPWAWTRRLVFALCALATSQAQAQSAPPICLPQATGPAFASGAPDWWTAGQPAGLRWDKPDDPRWLGAFSRDYGYGSTSQQEFRALTVDESEPTPSKPNFKRTYLVLSWQFKLAPAWASAALKPRLLVGFAGANGENARLLKTMVSGTSTGVDNNWQPSAVLANEITFYKNLDTPPMPPRWATDTPIWLSNKAKLHYWANTTNNQSAADRWVIQMKLPIDGTGTDGLPIDPAGFKFWFSAVHPSFALAGASSATVAANFFTWPDSGTTYASIAQNAGGAQLIADWAPARADGSTTGCAGISLSSSDIGTRRGGMDSNRVSVTQANELFARPVLHASSAVSAAVPANVLTATFRFANWGSQALGTYTGGSWSPPDPAAMTPSIPIDTAGMSATAGNTATTTIQSTWALTPAERCRFTGKNGVTDALGNRIQGDANCSNDDPIVDLHSCMQVELNGPGQLFINNSAFRNMNFVQASDVVRSARVATEPNAAGGARDVYLHVQRTNMPQYEGGPGGAKGASGVINVTPQQREIIATLTAGGTPSGSIDRLVGVMPSYLVHAYHDTWVDLTDENGVKLRLLAPQTSFGYIVAHDGPLLGWQDQLAGAQAVPGVPDVYRVAVPNGGDVKVTNRIRAVEADSTPGALTVRLAVGRTFPHGGFGTSHSSDLSVALSIEYSLTPAISVEAMAGGHRFKGKSGAADIDVTQVGINAKWYFAPQPWRWFTTAGVASYAFDPGTTRAGVNAGVGLQFHVTPLWSVEGRYELHSIRANSPNSSFSSATIGLRYAF